MIPNSNIKLYANFQVAVMVPESRNYKLSLKVVNDLEYSGPLGLDTPDGNVEIFLETEKDNLVEVDFNWQVYINCSYGSCGMEVINPGDIIKETAEHAEQYEQVNFITDLNKGYECEGFDRKIISLPTKTLLLKQHWPSALVLFSS